MNIQIEHSLSPLEIIQFPFVSPYGLRHLQKGGALNVTIGAIELFPILGPIVSLIEAVVTTLLKDIDRNYRLHQEGWKNKLIGVIEVLPLIGSLVWRIDALIQRKITIRRTNLPVESVEKWMSEFKANVRNKMPIPPCNLSLNKEQEQELIKVIKTLEQNPHLLKDLQKAVLLANNLDWVFKIESIPGVVFKVPKNRQYNNVKTTVERRYEDTTQAKQLIQGEGFDHLHVPEQALVYLKIDNETIPVLIEESLNHIPGTSAQESLFQSCYKDPELKPFMRECVRQLILFIIKTNYSDVRYDNNPLLTDGRGFGLIDLDRGESPYTGLSSGCSSGQDGILQYLSVEEIEHFEPLLKKELTDKQFNNLGLDSLKERLRKREKEEPGFKNYLTKRNVKTSREPVDLTGWNPFPAYSIALLEEKINNMASYRLGFDLPSDRCFYVKDHFYPGVLDNLKRTGKIYNWQDFKEINPNSAGYFIWA